MSAKDHFNPSQLLTLPFETGACAWPKDDDRTLIYNAQYWNGVSEIENYDVVQSFAPYADIWANQSKDVQLEIKGEYGFILLSLPKQKESALCHIAQSLSHLKENGLLIVAAANDAGGKRLEKWMAEFGLTVTSLSKSKCRVSWAVKKDVQADIIDQYIKLGAPQSVDMKGESYLTQAGIYGWNKIDRGSKILTENLNDSLKGKGADFGCGYGYLSRTVVTQYDGIQDFYALEADYQALECARINLKDYGHVHFEWLDITQSQSLPHNLDFIIMNPPFHDGKKADNTIGQKFIMVAHKCLRKKGTLYMVANAHLPYEKILNQNFESVEKLAEEEGFKVYKAIK